MLDILYVWLALCGNVEIAVFLCLAFNLRGSFCRCEVGSCLWRLMKCCFWCGRSDVKDSALEDAEDTNELHLK